MDADFDVLNGLDVENLFSDFPENYEIENVSVTQMLDIPTQTLLKTELGDCVSVTQVLDIPSQTSLKSEQVRSELINKRVFWEEHSSKHFPISFDGVPFFVLGSRMRECCHGPDRHRSEKHKAARVKTSRKADHEYTGDKRRRVLIQNTKKMDCPASIHIRAVVRFPIYQIEENSEWARRKQSKRLLADLRNTEEVVWEYRVHVALPPHDAHRNHRTDEVGSMTHNVDKKVIGKIHALVEDGVRDVGEMKRHIKSFSKTNFPGVPECSNRFFPNNRCLRNHMYAALSLSQFSTEDQENLQQHITAWRQEKSDDCFYFVPSPKEENNDSDKEDFIFVHQTAWQRRLLSMYGNEICLLDATYCVCKCDVALFFLCVSTNIGYITVGCFLVAAETVKNITRGLQILKQWNRDWSPAFFMTDYDQKEIAAIETTFPDCFTYLCDFHREQSWERWLKSKGVKRYKEELLQKMRDIAHADSEESFQDAVTSLKDSEYWQENEHLRVWFENQWLSASKRWVSYHRQSLKNVRVTTTNGLERQHYQLKQNYLKQYTEGTVTSLISTIINQFVPDSFKRYRESNAKCLDTSHMYSDIVPQFLHNRLQPFRDHCTKRLSSAMLIPMSDITVLAGQKFKVKSADTSTDYVLDFSEPLPKCSCPDWKRSHLPCKHMLSILLKVQGCGWESLSDEFTNSPHLNVDRGVLSDFTSSSTSGLDSSRSNMFDTSTPVATKTHTTRRAQRQGTVALGSRCKMLAFSIHSMLHLVQNTSDYEPIYSDLMALHVRIRCLVPQEAGLLRRPPRPGRKLHKHGILRKRRRYRKAQRKNVKSVITAKEQASARPRIVPLDSTFDESSTADTVRNAAPSAKGLGHPIKGPAPAKPKIVSLDDPSTAITDVERDVTDPLTGQADSSNSFRQTAETVLQQLLNTPPTDRPIVQIGPYTITDSSMHYLNSTLSDEVIDSRLHLMVTGNVCHIDCANMTAIFDSNGSQDSTSYLPRLQLQRYDALLGAVNEGGDHWVLMIIIPGAKRLVYMNPLGELTTKVSEYEDRWCMFLTKRCQRGIEKETMRPDGWCMETVPHSKQLDSSSCGIYVIKFAEQYLSGKQENVSLTSKNLVMERRRIQLQLLSRGIQEQEMLALPVRQTSEGDLESVGHKERGQHEETCRKRKRKDERKSSIFVYNVPKKTSRKTKSCVCRQKDDGRKYWNCEGCDEWYHPECMGLKVEEEPDEYICPGCQGKNNEQFENDCPTLSEVEEELLESIRIEEADQYDDSLLGDLQEQHSGLTPVSLNNPAVQFFVDIQKQKGQIIEIKQTGWGPFILLTDEIFDDFISFRNSLNVNELLTISVALRFFLNKYGKNIKVMHVSEKVVRLDPVHAVYKYREWLQQMKESLSF